MAQAQVWPLWETSRARARGASGKKRAMGTSVQIQQLKAIEAMHSLALHVLPVPTFQLWLCPKFTVCPWSCHLTPLHSLHWLQSSTRRCPGGRALLHCCYVLLYLPRMDNIAKHHFLLHFQATTLGRLRTPWREHRLVTSSPGTQLKKSVSPHRLFAHLLTWIKASSSTGQITGTRVTIYPLAPPNALVPISQAWDAITLFLCFTAEHFFSS